MNEKGIKNYVITQHAKLEFLRRDLAESIIKSVLSNPDQRMDIRKGRVVLQSRVTLEGKQYLVRIFVDIDRQPAEVVTAYRTSKISKYWR